MHESAPFTWLSLFGVQEATEHVVMAVLVGAVLVLTTVIAAAQVKRALTSESGLIPDEKLTYKNFFEIIAEQLYKLTESVIGHHDAPLFFPVIGSMFVFIFTSNLIGLVPGFVPPTENMNTTLALGVFVFIYYNIIGFKVHGMGYLKHFLGPIW